MFTFLRTKPFLLLLQLGLYRLKMNVIQIINFRTQVAPKLSLNKSTLAIRMQIFMIVLTLISWIRGICLLNKKIAFSIWRILLNLFLRTEQAKIQLILVSTLKYKTKGDLNINQVNLRSSNKETSNSKGKLFMQTTSHQFLLLV